MAGEEGGSEEPGRSGLPRQGRESAVPGGAGAGHPGPGQQGSLAEWREAGEARRSPGLKIRWGQLSQRWERCLGASAGRGGGKPQHSIPEASGVSPLDECLCL